MVTATLAGLRRQMDKLRAEVERQRQAADSPALAEMARDPASILTRAGMDPDPWQTDLLRSFDGRVLILASRQVGKSLTAAGLALREALLTPGSLTLLLSPTLRQSSELFRDKVLRLYSGMGRPLSAVQESALQLSLANGSRIVSLPGSEATIRCFSSVALLVIDEAARVPDPLYQAVRPMLAVSAGKLVCLSSAYARLGFFYEAWTKGGPEWRRVKVTAAECGRIDPAFLAEERAVLGDRIYSREYACVFSAADDAAFDPLAIERALAAVGSGPPLF
jgi:hypothetical protein